MNELDNQLYAQLGKSLEKFIFKHIKNETDTADILQEVFIKIHNKISSLKDTSRLNSWVYQIARNTIIDFKRKSNRTLDDQELTDYSFIENESDQTLKHGLLIIAKSLPEKYGEIIILKNFENMKNSEISKKLGITEPAVKSRLYRARKEFKNKLLQFCHFEFDVYGTVIDYEPTNCFICYLKNKKNCK